MLVDKNRIDIIVKRLKDKCIDHDTIGGRAVVIMTVAHAQELVEILLEMKNDGNQS